MLEKDRIGVYLPKKQCSTYVHIQAHFSHGSLGRFNRKSIAYQAVKHDQLKGKSE